MLLCPGRPAGSVTPSCQAAHFMLTAVSVRGGRTGAPATADSPPCGRIPRPSQALSNKHPRVQSGCCGACWLPRSWRCLPRMHSVRNCHEQGLQHIHKLLAVSARGLGPNQLLPAMTECSRTPSDSNNTLLLQHLLRSMWRKQHWLGAAFHKGFKALKALTRH